MIGFNPTPELKELLTHHHNKHKNIHIQPRTQLQIKRKTHEITHCHQISSRHNYFESKPLSADYYERNPNFLFLGTSTPQVSTPNNLTLRSYLQPKRNNKDKIYLWKNLSLIKINLTMEIKQSPLFFLSLELLNLIKLFKPP